MPDSTDNTCRNCEAIMLTRVSLPPWYRDIEILSADYSVASIRAWDLRSGDQMVIHVCRQDPSGRSTEAEHTADLFLRLPDICVPGVARVAEAGLWGNSPYAARAFIPGEPLEARLHRSPQLTAAEAARIYAALSAALANLKERAVVHGGLTARNVILARDGSIVVTDPLIRAAAARFTVGSVHCRWERARWVQDDFAALRHLQLQLDAAAARWCLDRPERSTQQASFWQLFPLVWRPAAIVGLCASLGTVAGLANPEPPDAMPASTRPALHEPLAAQPTARDAQLRRLVHLGGLEAALLPDVANDLALTEHQRQCLQQILDESRRSVAALVEAAADTDGEVPGLLMRAVRQRSEGRFAGCLTPQQRLRWAFLRAPVSEH